MNELSQVENFNAKIYGTAEEPLFLARDIAEMLEIKNNRDMLNNVDDDEKLMSVVSTSGQNRQMWFLTESGLYEVLMLSRKPKAKEFKRKVKEILKTIRKHGAYMTDSKLEEALLNPDTLINLATQLKQEREEKAQLRALNSTLAVENQIMQPKAQYFDDLVERNLLTNFRDTAKMLKIKQTQFIDWLLDRKYIYRDKKSKLMPYAQYNETLFEIKESKGATSAWKGSQTLITPTGRETFNLLLNENKAS